jgi:hypothetical protein
MNVNKTVNQTPLEVEKGRDNTSRGILSCKTREGILLMRYDTVSNALL